jgi:hypothetical protein
MRSALNIPTTIVPAILALVLLAIAEAQATPPADQANDLGASLARLAPELNERLVGLERAQAVLLTGLSGADGPRDEAAVLTQMRQRISSRVRATAPDPLADSGLGVLGVQGRELVQRTQALYRELVAVYVSVAPAERKTQSTPRFRNIASAPRRCRMCRKT